MGHAEQVDAESLAIARGWDREKVESSIERLAQEHLIAIIPDTSRVWMAHPFSGVETGYVARIGTSNWNANCAWDALAIIALLGSGNGRATGPGGDFAWQIHNGEVSPSGVVHLLVPARDFWQDIGFT